MKSCQTFLLGLVLGTLTGIYAERYSRTTSRGRKIRREVDRTVRELYGSAEQEIGRLKEKINRVKSESTALVEEQQ